MKTISEEMRITNKPRIYACETLGLRADSADERTRQLL